MDRPLGPPPPGQVPRDVRRRAIARLVYRTTVMLALLTVAYYLLPVGSPLDDGAAVVRTLCVLVALGLVAVVLRAQWAARHGPYPVLAAIEALLTSVYLLVLVFSGIYVRLAEQSGQFVGLDTRTDALYFTTTLVTTIGFGDVHPAGTAARALVTAQMVFNLLYLGAAVRILVQVRSTKGPSVTG
ncbi:MAG: potassium channel family protein [Acidimicrobiia bacterium]